MMRVAIPNKGRMREPGVSLLKSAGLKMLSYDDKSLFLKTTNPVVDVMCARVDDIPRFVEEGVADVGMVGQDVLAETGASVREVMGLNFGHCSVVLAAKDDSEINGVEDIPDGARVASKFTNITKKYFKKIGKKVEIVEMSGAVEIAPVIGLADVIVDLSSTGSTLKTHGLEVIETIMDSQFVLIANREYSNELLDDLVLAINGVVNAEKKKYLIANIPEKSLSDLEKTDRGLLSPTVTRLDKEGWISVQVVVEDSKTFRLIKKIKELGGRDILVIPIERLVK